MNFTIHHKCETTSTNDDAKGMLQHGAVVVATKQTAGRGRQGRIWQSLEGNLHASLILKPTRALQEWPTLSFVMALAIAQAIQKILPHSVTVKWPNDVLVEGKKISGILCECVGDYLIIGFGVNCVAHPDNTLYPTTNLVAEGAHVTPLNLLNEILQIFSSFYDVWATQGFAPLRPHWLKKAHKLHENITIRSGADEITGIFKGIGDDGALHLLMHNGQMKMFTAGDVLAPDQETH